MTEGKLYTVARGNTLRKVSRGKRGENQYQEEKTVCDFWDRGHKKEVVLTGFAEVIWGERSL